MYDSIYIKCPDSKSTGTESRFVFARGEEERKLGTVTLRLMKMF